MVDSSIEKKETVLAVFGGAGLIGINSTVLSTKDRLTYIDASSVLLKYTVVLYSDLSGVELKYEGKNKYICLLLKDGNNVKINIKANSEEAQKMYEFLKDYKDKGTEYIAQRINDKNHAWKIDVIHQHKDLRSAMLNRENTIKIQAINKKHEKNFEEIRRKEIENQARIHEKYEAKINRIASSRTISNYKLTYRSGFGKEKAVVESLKI